MVAASQLPPLYVITDRECARRGAGSVEAAVDGALEGGAPMVQFRDKQVSDARSWPAARRIAQLCRRAGARLLINTRADITSLLEADGVHRPGDGLPVAVVRKLLDDALVGVSCHDRTELQQAERDGADFATLSPVFETDSKPGYGPPLGLETFSDLADRVDLPVYALGGITPDRAADCLEAGARGVAVMSGIMAADSPRRATSRYLRALEDV